MRKKNENRKKMLPIMIKEKLKKINKLGDAQNASLCDLLINQN
jgi:hypothetical protein